MRIAAGSLARARGLLFRSRSWLGEGGSLLLVPCSSVHSFLMREPIDLAFIDASGVVLRSEERVRPGRVVSCRGAVAVLERFSPLGPAAGEQPAPWPGQGDALALCACGPPGAACWHAEGRTAPASGDHKVHPEMNWDIISSQE